MSTDQTDHRAMAERDFTRALSSQNAPTTMWRLGYAHHYALLAINDEQREQTEWLHRIRDLLAVMAEPKGDPCPCGCRRDVEPKPSVSRDLSEMQDRINATLSDPNIDAALDTVRHVGVNGVHEAGGCEDCSEPEPDAEECHFAPYGSTNALCGETVPRRVGWDVGVGEYTSGRFTTQRKRTSCRKCLRRMAPAPEPASESVTVTLPRDVAPVVACICGSTRQRVDMADLNRRLTMEGKIVLAPGVFGHDGDPLTDEDKVRLDELHFRKIDMADEVHFIAKPDGSLGASTTREYDYAKATGKKIWNHPALDAASATQEADQGERVAQGAGDAERVLVEPAHLGAVVRNSFGHTYIRTSVGTRKREWTRESTSNAVHWTETEAVEVVGALDGSGP